MSKVFEALLRQQQSEQNGNATHDPLAAETGSPESFSANGESGESSLDSIPFELPSVIGTPVGPRSNEGALFASLHQPAAPSEAPKPVRSNGTDKQAVESTRLTSEEVRDIADRLKKAPPVIRQTAVEHETSSTESEVAVADSLSTTPNPSPIANQQSEIRNQKRQHEVRVEPIVQSRLHPRLILLTDPQTAECEQYRTLRTQLFHAAEKKKTQVVTITSTLAGEGKTSTVINLGLAIAQSEKRVLIIDGDLRRPNVAAYLGVQPKTGFGETLRGETNPLDSLFTLENHEMYVLAVSRESANPTELLSSERLVEMIAELRGYFDFILIDSPPVLPFADARLLANQADAVMLVVRAGMAQYETVEKAVEALPAAKMLGVVLNDAEVFEEAGYYDYYYNYSQRNRRRSWWQKLLSPIKKSPSGRKLKL
ncbi:MAG: CpsD/CapB family tyrosine-protein kinase [Acidobacteriota bacterium]|nr:CpsD/CapB family tyrosine-protein kinase [Acidobacteriota bacterium]